MGEATATTAAPAAANAVMRNAALTTSLERRARHSPAIASPDSSAATRASATAPGTDRKGSPVQKVTYECSVDTPQKPGSDVRGGKAAITSCSRVLISSP